MKRLNTSYLLSVLVGALLTGFAWRVRGTGGWGSAWGLLNVGMLLTLYLLAVRGKRDGVSLSLVSFTAASFMFTAPAWGTLNSQITGLMKVEYAAGEQIVFIPPVSGVILMLCMGFGLAAVFSVMLGRCFSGQAWRLRDYAAVLAVFLLVSYGAKASVAHPLVGWLQPQTVEAFRNGLAENEEQGDHGESCDPQYIWNCKNTCLLTVQSVSPHPLTEACALSGNCRVSRLYRHSFRQGRTVLSVP